MYILYQLCCDESVMFDNDPVLLVDSKVHSRLSSFSLDWSA